MAWNTQRGGPWGGGGGGQGPWGGGGPGRQQPPDIEEMLRRSQDRFKRFIPSGGGGVKRIVMIVLAAIVLWLATGFYTVQPDEQGLALVFGKFSNKTLPGLNYNWPSPIGTVFRPKVTIVNQVQVGFRAASARSGGATRAVPEESLMLTGDENIIDVRFVTFWIIKDAEKFLFNIRNPELTVKAASESAMREILGKNEFEFIRTKGRDKMSGEAIKLTQTILDDYGAGIEVTDVVVQDINPPASVLDSFRDVQAARADMERAINEATAYLNEITQRAQGEAAKITNEAEAFKAEKIAVASGEAQRFLSVLGEYEKDKVVTKRRMYLETMKGVMSGMDKVLIDNSQGGSGVVPYLPLPELQNRARTGGNR
ncbi:MAG: FtsH protease activity modulator HflK [Rhodospirillales bacterium]|jgi:membrane protease subunit HflK|nr:FtsH protease activity modulator HflK [Rhodospirillales bacterium]MDP6643846.1 FtsH protease activity modulator HflK [Rhodospirillales bacterium]MDP6843603.1 FtsH protease activity modulator HflK [Rhodospirillales bacterium]|tara:strand:+ start:1259 stop:2365 length:1107 start_codon:yes stop_codon:yes gene_type:complete